MRKGIVKIAAAFLLKGMDLPKDWILENIYMRPGEYEATAVIVGPDFPEVKEGESIKECQVIVHTRELFFEVKPL